MYFKWPESISEAREIQRRLRASLKIKRLPFKPKIIAGADSIFTKNHTISVVVVLRYPSMQVVEEAHHMAKTVFPYVPGYLSFREGPTLVSAIRKLKHPPDVILFDGQGIAHPKGLGIATHLGVLLGIPSIGCAKSRLVGSYEMPDENRGSWSPLIFEGKTVGAVLRTRTGVKPVFVSPGHLITLKEAIEIVLKCSRYRIPEPIRLADRLTRKLKASLSSTS